MSESETSLQEELASLTADLRGILEWERSSGATFLEAEPRQAPPSVPAQRAHAEPPRQESPRPHQSRPVSRPSLKPARQTLQAPATSGVDGEDLQAIRNELGECQRCGLSANRQSVVFGVGSPKADLVVIGEAPGRNEDVTGEPFVGRAGKLLNRMLEAIGLKREVVYISNVIKCRPPQNRDPEASEIASCSPFLHRQLKALEPKVIMTVGRFAGQNIVGSEASMGELRREIRSMNGIPVVPTYHPAYLLRNPRMKRAAWEDLRKVQELLEG